MMTGNRYEPMVVMICIAIYYKESFIKKIKPWQFVLIIAMAYFLLKIISAISANRLLVNTLSLSDLFNTSGGIQVLYSIFGEFGEAIYNVAQGVKYFPSSFSVSQFSRIFMTFLHIIPGLATAIPEAKNSLYYIYNFPNHFAMGGSYIGEMYFWAGSIGFILAFPIGYLMGFIENKKGDNRGYFVFLRVAMYLAFLSLIRGYLFNSMRVVVWFYIISMVLMNTKLPRLTRHSHRY
jgi:hypothetical protein